MFSPIFSLMRLNWSLEYRKQKTPLFFRCVCVFFSRVPSSPSAFDLVLYLVQFVFKRVKDLEGWLCEWATYSPECCDGFKNHAKTKNSIFQTFFQFLKIVPWSSRPLCSIMCLKLVPRITQNKRHFFFSILSFFLWILFRRPTCTYRPLVFTKPRSLWRWVVSRLVQ